MTEIRPVQAVAIPAAPSPTFSRMEQDLGEVEGTSNGARMRAFHDSLRSFCDSCSHSRFIHSDDGATTSAAGSIASRGLTPLAGMTGAHR